MKSFKFNKHKGSKFDTSNTSVCNTSIDDKVDLNRRMTNNRSLDRGISNEKIRLNLRSRYN